MVSWGRPRSKAEAASTSLASIFTATGAPTARTSSSATGLGALRRGRSGTGGVAARGGAGRSGRHRSVALPVLRLPRRRRPAPLVVLVVAGTVVGYLHVDGALAGQAAPSLGTGRRPRSRVSRTGATTALTLSTAVTARGIATAGGRACASAVVVGWSGRTAAPAVSGLAGTPGGRPRGTGPVVVGARPAATVAGSARPRSITGRAVAAGIVVAPSRGTAAVVAGGARSAAGGPGAATSVIGAPRSAASAVGGSGSRSPGGGPGTTATVIVAAIRDPTATFGAVTGTPRRWSGAPMVIVAATTGRGTPGGGPVPETVAVGSGGTPAPAAAGPTVAIPTPGASRAATPAGRRTAAGATGGTGRRRSFVVGAGTTGNHGLQTTGHPLQPWNAKKAPRGEPSSKKFRRRPTLPGGLPPSTIGAGGLNFRVRHGNGCNSTAIATGNLLSTGFLPRT